MTASEAADTVVLLHGLLCDSSLWAHQRGALAADHHVVVPEFRGFDSLTSMATSVLDAVDGDFDLVGHSMGGRVALEIVRLAPRRVRSLALLDTGVHPVGEHEPAQRQVLLDVAQSEGITGVARDWIPPMVHPDRLDDRALMDSMRAMVEAYSVDEFRGHVRALLGRRDATPLLRQVECPTLVACGRFDQWSTLSQHEHIAAGIPGSRLAVIEHAGHMVSVEQPDAVTDLLSDFLASASNASAAGRSSSIG